jgi:hypothetical protein
VDKQLFSLHYSLIRYISTCIDYRDSSLESPFFKNYSHYLK